MSLTLLLTGCGLFGLPAVDEKAVVRPPDPSAFERRGLVDPLQTVPCVLSAGTESTCLRVRIAGRPSTHAIGPFCPRNVSDGAEAVGLWIAKKTTHDLTGSFVRDLATFYDDPAWNLLEADGTVRVTDTFAACQAAARPDVDPRYHNHCVECALDDLQHATTIEVLLPASPMKRVGPIEIDRRSKVGVSLEGVVFDPPAPVDDILAAHTIAAFDDCGGHVNPHTGYHYHADTGCSHRIAQPDGHAPLIGYALDGFGLYQTAAPGGAEPTDLDACRGHSDPTRGYHYHVATAGENALIGCFMGEPGTAVQAAH